MVRGCHFQGYSGLGGRWVGDGVCRRVYRWLSEGVVARTVVVKRRWLKKVCQLGLCIKCTKLDGKVVKVVVIRVFFGVLGFLVRVSN